MTEIYRNIVDLLNSSDNILNNRLVQILVDVLPIAVVIANAEGEIIYSNHETYSIFRDIKLDANEALEKDYTLLDMDGEEIPIEEIPLYRTLIDGNIYRNREICVKFSNSKSRFISVSSSPLLDDDHCIIGALAGFYDITLSKANQQKSLENEETVKSLINGITENMTLMDVEGKILAANQAFAKRFGKNADDMIDYHIFETMPWEMASNWRDKIRAVMEKKAPKNFEDVWNGYTLQHHLFPVFNSYNEVTKIASFSQDITETKRIQEAFRESEERFRSVFENAALGMALISLEGHYFMVNNALIHMVGYTAEELENMTYHDLTHPDDVKVSDNNMNQLACGEIDKFQIEKRYINKQGEIVWVLLNVSIVKDSLGKPFYAIAQIQDITMSKQAEKELRQAKLDADQARTQAEKLAQIDYLTGLYNRGAFMNRLFEETNTNLKTNNCMSIIMIDIDHFKKINDTYGHKVGDVVLQQFATALKKGCRSYDFVGRYGGEEFILCLPETTIEEACKIADRMRSMLENLEIFLSEGRGYIHITGSFGVASAKPKGERCTEKLIECCDVALYQAKQRGRNRVEAYSNTLVNL